MKKKNIKFKKIDMNYYWVQKKNPFNINPILLYIDIESIFYKYMYLTINVYNACVVSAQNTLFS